MSITPSWPIFNSGGDPVRLGFVEANPRSAKIGNITEAIIESIERDTDIFPFKTKGVLIGATEYQTLQRNRYQLTFVDRAIEGVLDGGHNMLAIGAYILSLVVDEKELKKIRIWEDFKAAWVNHRSAIGEMTQEKLEFSVPVEVLVPANTEDDEIVDAFKSSLLEICAARNNNAELVRETKANQKGYYDAIKNSLSPEVACRIEWKTNMANADVKARDIVALAWIPLSLIKLPDAIKPPSPQTIYAKKGECSKLYDDLMSDESVSKPKGGPIHELHNTAVGSALATLRQLPELYDQIYADFPRAYNNWGDFGRIRSVRIFDPTKEPSDKYMRSQPQTHFTEQPVKYRYPDGFIMPLVYGLKALLKIENGKVEWVTDPHTFVGRNLKEIASAYKYVLEMSQYEPQRVGKTEASYVIALGEFEKALIREQAQAA
jgi:hypothetical protein